LFVTPRDGLSSLVETLAARLPSGVVRLNAPVESIARTSDGRWTVAVGQAPAEAMECDGLIMAASATVAGRLLKDLDSRLSADLSRITYAGSAIVTFGFRRDQIAHPLDGFGFVVPAIEKRRILAGSFSSVKFAGRAPDGSVLVRVFIGGACQADLVDLPDDRLRQAALDELRDLLGVVGMPLLDDITRWPRSMPQYHVGHCELVDEIQCAAAHWPGLALAGNAYHGVGIPNCIHSGEQAAEQICSTLATA
jgi:protoporphyrinogen/coproporphyrinogen III oxidase